MDPCCSKPLQKFPLLCQQWSPCPLPKDPVSFWVCIHDFCCLAWALTMAFAWRIGDPPYQALQDRIKLERKINKGTFRGIVLLFPFNFSHGLYMASQTEGSLLGSLGSSAVLIASMPCVEVSTERIGDCIKKKGRVINYSPHATKHRKHDHCLTLTFSPLDT